MRFKVGAGAGCGSIILIALLNLFVGAWSVAELLMRVGHTLPLFPRMIIGVIGGELTIPLAVISVILRWFGI